MKKLIIKVKTLHERDEEIHTAMIDNLIFSSFENEKVKIFCWLIYGGEIVGGIIMWTIFDTKSREICL